MQHQPIFRQALERCATAMVRGRIFRCSRSWPAPEKASQMHRTEIAQPAIFAMQVALAELWKSWGVEPAAMVGHSVGEIAAACVAGIFTIEEGARVIAWRAQFMDGCARGEGTMLAVGLDEEEARALIARHDRTVSIAAFNGPRSLTLAGTRLSLETMLAELEPQGIFARLVRVDHPFHHRLMEPAASALEEALADLQPQAESAPFFPRSPVGDSQEAHARLRIGATAFVSQCSLPPQSRPWRKRRSTSGWKSARIPRCSILCRNASPSATEASRRCSPRFAASASTSLRWKPPWTCTVLEWSCASRT